MFTQIVLVTVKTWKRDRKSEVDVGVSEAGMTDFETICDDSHSALLNPRAYIGERARKLFFLGPIYRKFLGRAKK